MLSVMQDLVIHFDVATQVLGQGYYSAFSGRAVGIVGDLTPRQYLGYK